MLEGLLGNSKESAEAVVHSNLDIVMSYMSISKIISVETLLAVFSSLIFSYFIFYVLRRYEPVQNIILPGLALTRAAHDKAEKLVKREKPLTASEYSFVSGVLQAYAIRGAASLLVVAWIFATMVSVVAPLF